MRLLEKLRYQWTDNRRKLLLALAMTIALSLVILQSLILGSSPSAEVILATRIIESGEMVGKDNTESVAIDASLLNRYDYADACDGRVAIKKLQPGEFLLQSDLGDPSEFYAKGENDRLVSLELEPVTTAAYGFGGGDRVDLIHVTGDEVLPLRIFAQIQVYEMVYGNPKSPYPETVTLLVEESVRDYILAHRGEGHFEISP